MERRVLEAIIYEREPPIARIILNRVTLYPLFVIQRMFYRTGLGVVMMGMGRVPNQAWTRDRAAKFGLMRD